MWLLVLGMHASLKYMVESHQYGWGSSEDMSGVIWDSAVLRLLPGLGKYEKIILAAMSFWAAADDRAWYLKDIQNITYGIY